MTDDDTQVLRQLAAGWLECRDSQGVFFYNPQTKEVSVEFPEEAGGFEQRPSVQPEGPRVTPNPGYSTYAQAPLPQAGGQQCRTPQPPRPPQPALTPPRPVMLPPQVSPGVAALGGRAAPGPLPRHDAQGLIGTPMAPPPAQQMPPFAAVSPQKPVPQQEAVAKLQLGDWVVYQDDVGPFYYHVSTQQQFEEPPPELLALYKQYRSEQDSIFEQKMSQIRQQQQDLQDQHLKLQQQILSQDCPSTPLSLQEQLALLQAGMSTLPQTNQTPAGSPAATIPSPYPF